jgi:hypothetical protein
MTNSQVRKLAKGETFRRPSTNSHDEGWRLYTVVSATSGLFNKIHVVDQHGYSQLIDVDSKCNRDWFKVAEKTVTK